MTNEMPLREARRQLGHLIDRAEHYGETTVVTRYGRPAALITPIPQEPTMALSTDPRLLVHGVAPDGQPIAAKMDWERQGQRYRVHAVGTKTLGYVYLESVRSDNGSVRQEFRATTRDGVELGKGATLEDGAALVVAAAHGQASTHTLTIVRGEQPDANGVEFGTAGITVSDEVYAWFAANGVSDDDPDVWVLVTPADEQPGAVNVIATREV